jgi:hypothetical protein
MGGRPWSAAKQVSDGWTELVSPKQHDSHDEYREYFWETDEAH